MKIIITGDFCPQGRVSNYIQSGNYTFVSDEFRHLLKGSDFTIVNLEAPLCDDEKFIPITKEGPNLKAPEQTIEALKDMSVNCVTLANNHINDFGGQGIINTINLCEKHGIEYVGAGKNQKDAERVLYKDFSEGRLALINCCEHEFSVTDGDYAGAQGLNPIMQYYQIQEARKKADIVIVIVHGGIEMFQYPTFRMRDTYRFFIDAGADIVINHHQHCRCGKEKYKGKTIYYGLGNFCFDWDGKPSIWYRGYALDITIRNRLIGEERIVPIVQCLDSPIVRIDDLGNAESEIQRLSDIIVEDVKLAKEIQSHMQTSTYNCRRAFEPVNNRFVRALQLNKVLPSFITKRWKIRLQDYILCESHREKVEYWLKQE